MCDLAKAVKSTNERFEREAAAKGVDAKARGVVVQVPREEGQDRVDAAAQEEPEQGDAAVVPGDVRHAGHAQRRHAVEAAAAGDVRDGRQDPARQGPAQVLPHGCPVPPPAKGGSDIEAPRPPSARTRTRGRCGSARSGTPRRGSRDSSHWTPECGRS